MHNLRHFAALAALVSIFFLAPGCPASAGTPPGRYMEIPQSAYEPTNTIVTTRAVLDGREGRSFTYRYDMTNRIALWVAYPLNRGLIGTGSRGEEWLPDPGLPASAQPTLYRGFYSADRRYDRGHQIPSADRLDPEPNAQTFRFTNATPQLHDFNGGVWADLEKLVRRWCYQSDTLYVVTGCVPGRETISDNNGNPVNIPKAYYKVVLRLHHWKNGQPHWQACALYLRHNTADYHESPYTAQQLKEFSMSVSDLEKTIGVKNEFFPNLAEKVEPETAVRIRHEDPRSVDWWWR